MGWVPRQCGVLTGQKLSFIFYRLIGSDFLHFFLLTFFVVCEDEYIYVRSFSLVMFQL